MALGVMASKAVHRKQWPVAIDTIKKLLADAGLKAEVKWGSPCYSYNGQNVAIVDAFKHFFVLTFFKGVLLKDPKKLLVAPGANSEVARMFKFTDEAQVAKLVPVIKAYIKEAVELEKKGAKVEKTAKAVALPDALQAAIKKDAAFKKAFTALTPGRQRAYAIFVGGAKQAETRAARVEKHRARILAGKGMLD
jgi:uncharacterized protein YdeI (YjbR/CyaY-like superfamily)